MGELIFYSLEELREFLKTVDDETIVKITLEREEENGRKHKE